MNDRLNRFFSRHRWVPPVIAAAICVPLMALSILTDESVGGYVFFCVVWLLLSFLVGSAGSMQLVSKAAKALNEQGDPHPLLEETTYQLGYVKNRSDRTMLSINRCAGLIEAGYVAQALEEMEALNIDAPTVAHQWRYVYYHNLTVAAIHCGQSEKAEIYYQKTTQQLELLRGKMLRDTQDLHRYLSARIYLMRRDYRNAHAMLLAHQPKHLMGQVSCSLEWARFAIGQGDVAAAKPHLEFVMRYGNRLHAVAQAQQLWNEIHKTE